MNRWRKRHALPWVMASCTLLALSACTTTSTGNTSPAASGTSTPLQVAVQTTLHLNDGHYLQPALDWPRLALVKSPNASRQGPDSLVVIDLRSGKQTTVAHTQWPHGMLYSPVITGDWVAWTDQSAAQSTGGGGQNTPLQWTIHALNLVTGVHRTLARSGPNHEPLVPGPSANGGRVVWARPASSAKPSTNVYLADLRTGKKTRLMHGVSAGQPALSGQSLVYTLTQWNTAHTHYTTSIWSRPLNGGSAMRLSPGNSAIDPDVALGTVAWQQPNHGDPTELLISPVSQQQPRLVAGPSSGQARVGADFVAYFDTLGFKASQLNGLGSPVSLPRVPHTLDLALAVDGHHVVWGGPLAGRQLRTWLDVGTVNWSQGLAAITMKPANNVR